jgi:O-antigen ligase
MTAFSRLSTRLGFNAADDTFAGAATLALSLSILPLLQALPSDTDRTAALAFIPAVCLALQRRTAQFSKTETPDGWLLAFACLMALASAFLSLQFAANLVLTCAWICTVAVGSASRKLAQSEAAIRLIMVGLVLGCCTGLLWTRSQPIGNGIAFPLYGHARIFGLHMLLGAGAALALLVNAARNRIALGVTLIAGVVVWSGLLWSGSRGPLAGLSVGIAAWWWFGGAAERRRLVIWTPVLILSGLLGSHLLGTQAYNLGWKRAVASTVNVTSISGFSSERNLIWEQTLREIGSSPWLGQGADAYRFFQPLPVGDQPHNVVLQWVLAFGAPAALALLVLVGLRISRGLRGAAPVDATTAWRRAAAGGLLAAVIGALFDGVFYHAVAFIPAAVLAGVAGYVRSQESPTSSACDRACTYAGRALLVTAAIVIGVHAWLFFNLLAPPPSSPRTPAAMVLRVFPSATYGFWRWIETWSPSMTVEERLNWLHWAQRHSPQPAIFYYQQAQCKLEQRDLAGACLALEQAISTSNGASRIRYTELLRLTQDLASRSITKPTPLVPTSP